MSTPVSPVLLNPGNPMPVAQPAAGQAPAPTPDTAGNALLNASPAAPAKPPFNPVLSPTQAAGITTQPPVHPAVKAIARSTVKNPVAMVGRAVTSGMLASGLSAFSKFLELAGGGQQEAGKVPLGASGFLSGFSGVQKFKQDQQQQMTDLQLKQAQTGLTNAEMLHEQALLHQLDEPAMEASAKQGQSFMDDISEAAVANGTPLDVKAKDVDSDEIKQLTHQTVAGTQGQISGTNEHFVLTGVTENPDGSPRGLYTVYSGGAANDPDVKLKISDNFANRYNTAFGYKQGDPQFLEPGTIASLSTIASLQQQIATRDTLQKAQAEALKNDNATQDETEKAQLFSSSRNPNDPETMALVNALGKNNNDIYRAAAALVQIKDPKTGRPLYPNALKFVAEYRGVSPDQIQKGIDALSKPQKTNPISDQIGGLPVQNSDGTATFNGKQYPTMGAAQQAYGNAYEKQETENAKKRKSATTGGGKGFANLNNQIKNQTRIVEGIKSGFGGGPMAVAKAKNDPKYNAAINDLNNLLAIQKAALSVQNLTPAEQKSQIEGSTKLTPAQKIQIEQVLGLR